MIFRILIFIVFCLSSSLLFSQEIAFDLSIKALKLDNSAITLSLTNQSEENLELEEFLISNQNDIIIFDDQNKQMTFNFVKCGSQQQKIQIRPNENISWTYDLEDFFSSSSQIVSLEEGNYKIYWKVKEKLSEPFIYHYLR